MRVQHFVPVSSLHYPRKNASEDGKRNTNTNFSLDYPLYRPWYIVTRVANGFNCPSRRRKVNEEEGDQRTFGKEKSRDMCGYQDLSTNG